MPGRKICFAGQATRLGKPAAPVLALHAEGFSFAVRGRVWQEGSHLSSLLAWYVWSDLALSRRRQCWLAASLLDHVGTRMSVLGCQMTGLRGSMRLQVSLAIKLLQHGDAKRFMAVFKLVSQPCHSDTLV